MNTILELRETNMLYSDTVAYTITNVLYNYLPLKAELNKQLSRSKFSCVSIRDIHVLTSYLLEINYDNI
jgi:hypothetical protein